jgi:glucose-6-phosphate dehydrogenase assembly protein OpcA
VPKNYKVLGQSSPAITTNTNIYTVPANTEAVISTIIVANRSSNATTYRIAVRTAGAELANSHYIAYDVTVGGGDSTTISVGITLSATDVVTVYASSANLTFSIFGSEIQP